MTNIDSQFVALLGKPGTGKSYTIQKIIEENPKFGVRCSTTGISAMNIGGITINSLLNYYNTESLLEKFLNPNSSSFSNFLFNLKITAQKYKYIIIDETSLLSSTQLDLIKKGVDITNSINNTNLGLLLVGDIAQLPSILKGVDKGPFFKANCWKEFKVIYLDKIYRQTNQEFINVLNKIRIGKAEEVVDWVAENIGFYKSIDENFEGTTLFSKNELVDFYNKKYLDSLPGFSKRYYRKDYGSLLPEWKNIPSYLELKEGALVILLRNNSKNDCVNGDLGEVKALFSESVLVTVKRTGKDVEIKYATQENKPIGKNKSIGNISFIPLRIAKVLTTFKAQGLTLDKLQIRLGDQFLSRLSGGLYVALSRVKTPEGLRLVGNKDTFINSNYIDPEYLNFIINLESQTYKYKKELILN